MSGLRVRIKCEVIFSRALSENLILPIKTSLEIVAVDGKRKKKEQII